MLPTLVYPCLFAGPVFGQSIGQTLRYGLDGGDHLSSLLLGLDRDLFSLSGHHESSQGLQLYSNLFFTARNGLFYTPIFIFMGYYLYDHFHAQTFRVHRWEKLSLAFGLFCMEGIIIFQHEGIDKNFYLLLPFVTVYLVNACLRSSFLKSYDLQYLKQMSMALYFSHPIFIEWARYGFSNVPLSYPDRGKLIFVTALLGSHLFGLVMLSYHSWQKEKKNRSLEKEVL